MENTLTNKVPDSSAQWSFVSDERSLAVHSPFKNQNGQSMIQLLVSIGVMGIMMMAFVGMTTSQGRESRALTEKLAAHDLSRVISLTLGQASTCNLLFTAANVVTGSNLTFDPATVKYPFTINLQSVPQSGSVNVISLAQPLASDLSNTLKVQANAGITVQVTSATTAKLLINFDQANLVRPIHNLVFPISIATIPSGSNQKITGCQTASGGSCPAGQLMTGINPNGSPQCTTPVTTGVGSCPAGQLMIGINSNGSPQCTTQGSQAGAPCSLGSYASGTTLSNGSGRCCAILKYSPYLLPDPSGGGGGASYLDCVPF
jgi:type II secretory pathway pseudopilin PulG